MALPDMVGFQHAQSIPAWWTVWAFGDGPVPVVRTCQNQGEEVRAQRTICSSEWFANALHDRGQRTSRAFSPRVPGVLVRVEESARRIQQGSSGSGARHARLQSFR